MMNETVNQQSIRTERVTTCNLCGSTGDLLYSGLTDHLFGAPMKWSLKRCSNKDCGLIWLDPRPVPEDIGLAYQQYYTHTDTGVRSASGIRGIVQLVKEAYWSSKYQRDRDSAPLWKKLLGLLAYLDPGRRAYMDFQASYLPVPAGGKLLEAGCGSGWKLKILQDLGWEVEGSDIDEVAVANARSKGLKVEVGTLQDQNHPDDEFDAVLMSHLLEHVHDPEDLVRESRRVLKKGGSLVIVTPNSGSWGHARYKENWRGLEPPRHLHIYNPRAVRRLLATAGFSQIRTWTTIRGADEIFTVSRSQRQGGKYNTGGLKRRSLLSSIMQVIELFMLKFNSQVGEEIVVVATK